MLVHKNNHCDYDQHDNDDDEKEDDDISHSIIYGGFDIDTGDQKCPSKFTMVQILQFCHRLIMIGQIITILIIILIITMMTVDDQGGAGSLGSWGKCKSSSSARLDSPSLCCQVIIIMIIMLNIVMLIIMLNIVMLIIMMLIIMMLIKELKAGLLFTLLPGHHHSVGMGTP